MKPLSARDPLRVGLVAILVGGLLLALVVLLSVVSFGRSTYTAVLEHSAGLRPGEDVQVHGVSVGEVTGVDLEDRLVLVTFEIDQDVDLGSATTAEVRVATLLGMHYLEVDPAGDGELAGGRIPVERTSVPYNLQDVLEQGTTKLTELVTRRSAQTTELLRAARGVTDQLSDSSGDIVELMEAATLVADEVTSRRTAIHRLLVETTSLSEALRSIVEQTDAELGPTLRDLDRALDTLNQQDEQLRDVLEVMAPAFRYIANATGNGPYADLFAEDPALLADDARCKLEGCR